MNDLRQYILLLGNKIGTLEEVYSQPHAIMFVCPKYRHFCPVKIIGIYSSHNNSFEVKRSELVHRCSLHTSQEMEEYEMERLKHKNLRCGEFVERLVERGLVVGYYRVYELLKKHSRDKKGALISDDKENPRNSEKKMDTTFDDCLYLFETEFREIDSSVCTKRGPGEFFFKHTDYHFHLRSPVEIKIYRRSGGYLVAGFMFDPSNEPVLQSALLTNNGKEESILAFVKYNSEEVLLRQSKMGVERSGHRDRVNRVRDSYNGRFVRIKNEKKPERGNIEKNEFYLVELDMVIINLLQSANVDFFVKTRSVCAYLEEGAAEENSQSSRYFHNCNYEDKEYLKIDPKYYLVNKCKHALYGINNLPPADPEYISDQLLSQSFFVCLNSLLCVVSDDMRARQAYFHNAFDNLVPEWLNEILEEYAGQIELRKKPLRKGNHGKITYSEMLEKLSNCYCTCGKYQESLYPCIHVVEMVLQSGFDPLYFVSSVYSRNKIMKLNYVRPVVNIKLNYYLGKPPVL